MSLDHCIVLCTCPDQASAERLAALLVERELAACANVVPGLTSIYRWEGKVERAAEHLLIIKTHGGAFSRLEAAIRSNHPYQIPEIVAVPIVMGSADYLQWVGACVH